MSDLELLKTRAKAKRLYREYESIITLINQMTVRDRSRVIASSAAIDRLKKSELRRQLHKLESEVEELRQRFGVQVSGDKLVELLEIAEAKPGLVLNIMKHALREVFSRYEEAFSRFPDLPEHAYVVIDAGKFREHQGEVEWRAHEVTLYEDMCALFNLAYQRNARLNRRPDKKTVSKTASALSRSVIIAAYNFLESYFNGLALDHFLMHMDKLDDDLKCYLTEWDDSKKRTRYVSLRDKLLHYPRIVRSMKHPPFQESNSKELSFLLGTGKLLRDSIVHSSAFGKGRPSGPDAMEPLLNLEFRDVEAVVDNAIVLIRKTEQLVIGHDRRIDWLLDRGGDGLFSEQVFH